MSFTAATAAATVVVNNLATITTTTTTTYRHPLQGCNGNIATAGIGVTVRSTPTETST